MLLDTIEQGGDIHPINFDAFVGEATGYYDSVRATRGVDPVTGEELTAAERTKHGALAAAGFIPFVGWAGRAFKGGKAIHSTYKGMKATDGALNAYQTGRTLDNLRKAEYGLYGLTSANGLGEYATGRDIFGNELSEEQREWSLNEAFALLGGNAVGVGLRKASPTVNFANVNKNGSLGRTSSEIIAQRTKGLDLNKHPIKNKQLGPKKMKELKEKINNRTITKKEYNEYTWNKKFKVRRQQGVDRFWDMEKDRLKRSHVPTREWSIQQKEEILNNKRPKFNGRTIQGHHAYSASQYPHLANRGEVIYPTTFSEHFYGWHGGNWKNSLPGEPIKIIKDF